MAGAGRRRVRPGRPGRPDGSLALTGPDPIDVHAGGRIRTLRRAAGVTQEQLAQHLGLTFQQIQKYERGVNRVSVSMLYKIAEKLRADPCFVYDGLPDPARGGARPDPISAFSAARDALPLAKIFVRLGRQEQIALLAVARALAGEPDRP